MPADLEAGQIAEQNTLDHFLDVQKTVSTAELDKRCAAIIKAERGRQADKVLFDDLLDRLVTTVTDGYLAKIHAARLEGARSAELFEFEGDERFEDTDYSLLFLTKGPRKGQSDHFLRLNVMPFLPRLYHVVHPYNVDMTYFPETNLNVVNITW